MTELDKKNDSISAFLLILSITFFLIGIETRIPIYRKQKMLSSRRFILATMTSAKEKRSRESKVI